MCGIIGFWQNPSENEATLYQRAVSMADTLIHRGPDGRGVWCDPGAGLAFGFRRLAILDLSPTGDQPMFSGDGRFVIIFNGEIYNYRELRDELERGGTRFRGTSDTEVILEGASKWGSEAVIPRLWGMFALALWDRHERTLLLVRDRLGKKPLYYCQPDGAILFASELKALRAHPLFRAEIDRDALVSYMRFGYIPAPFSIYKGVYKLRAGHHALVRGCRLLQTEPYWDAGRIVEQGLQGRRELDDREALDQLDSLLRDAVSRRMIADVPLGAFLSGGIDSSSVVALMQAQSSIPVRTFSIGFTVASYNEADAAKRVAEHLGTHHTEMYVTPEETQAVIPNLPDLYDEPFADSSQIPTFLVSKLARHHVTVSLSGDGGDEVFGGYNRYAWAEGIWDRLGHFSIPLRLRAADAIRRVSPGTWDGIYRSLEWAVPARRRIRTAGDKLHKVADIMGAETPDALYHRLVSSWEQPDQLVVSGKETSVPSGVLSHAQQIPNLTDRMMYLDLITYLPDDILVKVDRASMGVSLEGRCPLLDHRLVEWAWRLPKQFKQRHGQSKWLLRQLLHRYVPPTLVERPKWGFGIPIGDWLRGQLREWAESLLNESRLQREGFLNPGPIQRAWAEHLSCRRNHQEKLWVILMFQAWLERWH